MCKSSINQVLGDVSWTQAHPNQLCPPTDQEQHRIQCHLQYVLKLLRQAPSPDSERSLAISHLEEYMEAALFPRLTKRVRDGDRSPVFIDDYSTPCAVGYLMQCTGAGRLAARLNQEWRYRYVSEFDLESELGQQVLEWAGANSLLPEELAMIQPAYDFMYRDIDIDKPTSPGSLPITVSYTHLTLPTKRIV
eukprot:TRINITY_DN26159_c0_g1_i1.p2 TRINITY_DN26159_c0_g1~~TRINITY_DN26159_c0_g1_i1.p2  ORF type:complete len:192 (-),score=42.28 TRINITY_DN26159_c0_g1_i1:133-708(-)